MSWDPSTYDVETLVASACSWECDFAGWLPVQNILPMMTDELEEELKALAAVGTLARVSGFSEIRALSHALHSISRSLDFCQWPQVPICLELSHF